MEHINQPKESSQKVKLKNDGMRGFAQHIIAVANEAQLPISNLQLQLCLFFVFGVLVKEHGIYSKLVQETHSHPFRRCYMGARVNEVYFDYNNFGGRPIRDNEAFQQTKFVPYNDKIIHLLKLRPFSVVETIHRLPSWADFKESLINDGFAPPYELADFDREFNREP